MKTRSLAGREPMREIPPLAMGVGSACRALGIGRTSLYKLIGEGMLRPVKLGGRTLIPTSQLQALIEREPESLTAPDIVKAESAT